MSGQGSIETKVIHSGELLPRKDGAVVLPVYQTAMYECAGGVDYHDIKYIRLINSPNHEALHAKLAALEGGEAALVAASGMAAITTTLLTLLSSGDHFLAQDCLYGGTHDFITRDIGSLGIEYDFIDGNDPGSWAPKLKPRTKLVYVESMTNPLLGVADLRSVVAFAREQGLLTLIDNTFPSPINFRPLEIGFDVVLHSCTKYLNGHSDIVGGAVVSNGDMIDRVTRRLDHLGGSMDPHACFLLHRGIKTLAVRMKAHNENALKLARFLEQHPSVSYVSYPGLESHPNHRIARELFDGSSGMLSFEAAGGLEAANRFLDRVRIPVVAPSLGGVESLVTRPAATSHSGMAREDRERLGITDSLVRVSVGIESADDLIEDFGRALEP
jgi:cystathionine beta-lyase/cystathionine gamma-synthase